MVSLGTVSNIKNHYFAGGLNRALHDLPRPGGGAQDRRGDGSAGDRVGVQRAAGWI